MRTTPTNPARRRLLALAAGGALYSPMARLLAAAGALQAPVPAKGYGPLREAIDENTGLPLLKLPEGFRYRSFAWAGEKTLDGATIPGAADGMGVVGAKGGIVTLIRNQEVVRLDGAYGKTHYDPAASGGTMTLRFDGEKGRFLDARASLSGTLQNCAGGVTPWGSWITCEEFVGGTQIASTIASKQAMLEHPHGFAFEVPAEGKASARPLVAMGQFKHEAATVHEASGHVFQTEDAYTEAGFYRFIPEVPGQLHKGGRLQMLKAEGTTELRRGLKQGQKFPVSWVDIENPEAGVDIADGEPRGVQRQGFAQGAARFTRLEGCIARGDEIFFTSTDGGDAACGQLFLYNAAKQELELLFESPGREVLDYPDNIITSPRGGLVICEDSRQPAQRLYGMAASGELFEFCCNNVRLDGQYGVHGDFRGAEWAGACFSPDGKWLFANCYTPGFTVAITGPWRDGLI